MNDEIREKFISLEHSVFSLRRENAELRALLLHVQRDFALFMNGTKERFNVLGLLLTDSKAPVDREKLG